jgi:hypothetical protein
MLLVMAAAGVAMTDTRVVLEVVDVEPVWAGHPVRFAIQTVGDHQYVAYYDRSRRMSLARRNLGSSTWSMTRLPSVLGWDSHNGLALAIDRDGHIHLAGNMHGDPLVYFRSRLPHDITSLERSRMVGSYEKKVSYPSYLEGPTGELYFLYRHGRSGSGLRVMNRYDRRTRTWKRLHDQPLLDGEGEMSAYPVGPVVGPDQWFHMIWMWRDTPSGATNHDLSYARSRDLINWESASGRSIDLPFRPTTEGVVVDPVEPGGGLAGIAFGLGWDSRLRPTINYTRYDAEGMSQIHNARWEEGRWKIYQTSDWDYRSNLDQTGTLHPEVVAHPVRRDEEGRLVQWFEHIEDGRGSWILDEERLLPVGRLGVPVLLSGLRRPESSFPGMEVRQFVYDHKGEYFLRWETLPTHRDRPRKPPHPTPQMLRVYRTGQVEPAD